MREMGFAKASWQLERVPNEEQAALNEQIKACQLDIEANTARIAVFADSRKYFRLVSDYLRMRADKYVVLGELPETANTFAISGYIPAYLAQSVADELSEKYQAVVELEELPETEEAPVLLKNNSFSEAVEGVLESYGVPKKGVIDPTVAMSIFYVFLFGMMLSDAAYGVIMAVGCGVA